MTVHGAKAKQDFITAVANKHSSHKVIVVGKRAGAFQEGQGSVEATAGKETICKIKRIFHYASGKKATCKVTVK